MSAYNQFDSISLKPEELRDIIKGNIPVRKCPDCLGEGNIWTLHYVLENDPDQDNEQNKDVSAQFAADFKVGNFPQYSYGECHLYECESCRTVGYIWN